MKSILRRIRALFRKTSPDLRHLRIIVVTPPIKNRSRPTVAELRRGTPYSLSMSVDEFPTADDGTDLVVRRNVKAATDWAAGQSVEVYPTAPHEAGGLEVVAEPCLRATVVSDEVPPDEVPPVK